MNNKPQKYGEIEERIWQNLNRSGLLPQIIAKSGHADDVSNYVGVELFNEFAESTRTGEPTMFIQAYIRHKRPIQPVTPKIYRFSRDIEQQKQICAQIWDGISEKDIEFIARTSAEEYSSGQRWMDSRKKTAMAQFLPALREGRVTAELIPEYAQYKVFAKR